jgi:hypothetical protein
VRSWSGSPGVPAWIADAAQDTLTAIAGCFRAASIFFLAPEYLPPFSGPSSSCRILTNPRGHDLISNADQVAIARFGAIPFARPEPGERCVLYSRRLVR